MFHFNKLFKHSFLLFIVSALLTSCSETSIESELMDEKTKDTSISLSESQADLESILLDIAGVTRGETEIPKIASSYTLYPETTRSEDDSTKSFNFPVHVFNFADSAGYAVMSATTEMPSLLILAQEGSFDMDAVSPDFASGLTCVYKDHLPFDEPVDYTKKVEVGPWVNTIYCEGGLCPVKWDQRDPYNKYCFTEQGEQAITGCVATAVAQFMAANQYPDNYRGYNFDWQKMTAAKKAYSLAYKYQESVAHLMRLVGTVENLHVTYGTERSGAYLENIPRTMRNFGYTNIGNYVNYNTETATSSLTAGKCVIVGGFSGNDGHCWLCHGALKRERVTKTYYGKWLYKTETETQWYVLCNWGWGGSCDGYYLSKAFDLSKGASYTDEGTTATSGYSTNENFSSGLKMVIGIEK